MLSGAETPLVSWATAPDGVTLAVQEWGNPEGAEILLIHGVAQSHLSFVRQFASPLARSHRIVTFDLRGHGLSAKPLEQAFYRDGRRWADDVRAVMAAAGLRRPVLVGWSLGGRVLRQYLIHHGDAGLSGINIVSARPIEDPGVVVPPPVPADDPSASPLAQRIGAIAAFLRACYATPPEPADFAVALAFNAMLPWEVRGAIAGWSTPVEAAIAALRRVRVPMLITHGRLDRLILPAAAEMTAAAVPHARISWYEQCGHSPFYEDAARFNRELAEFVAAATSR
jgi:pimeloyl-ACP methyl ester carboxylesterase